ncbi:MAG: leucine-rich repeat protein [Oscillospiraceae bacterium]|nr:leucine-rich repeat protein [Oscillospiraceae bacterium]
MAFTTQYTLQQVCDILDVPLPQEYQHLADTVLTNLTSIVNHLAEGGAFFLIGSNQKKREETLAKAVNKKPTIVFAGPASRGVAQLKTVPHIFVENAFDAMMQLSHAIREEFGATIIGITGSLGKTTTKELVYSVLSQQYPAARSPGNQNTAMLVFSNLQTVDKNAKYYVQEFGVGIRGATMARAARACLPNGVIITNISDPHLDVFGTRENILKEKLVLATSMAEGSPVFLNYDDALLKEVNLPKYRIISYAVDNKNADYYVDNLEVFTEYVTFDVVHGERHTPVTLHSRGVHNIYNAIVAFAVGEYFNVPLEKITQGISSFRSEGIRQSMTNIGGYQLYMDCYNTAPISLLGAIDVLERIPLKEGGKRIAVMGDIVRLGAEDVHLHRETGLKIGASKLDLALCFGNYNAKVLADAIREAGGAALYTADRDELNMWMRSLITKKDITLVKGPVARLLSRSVDQVFGTSFHLMSQHFEWLDRGAFRVKMIFEKEDHNRKMAALSKYKGMDKRVTLPAQIDGVDVFSVAHRCFLQNPTVQNVQIPEPIFNISHDAFSGCKSLSQVELPSTLKVIGNHAFNNCTALTKVTLPEGVIDIGDASFASCESLKQITLPASLGRIGDDAFVGCPNLTIRCFRDSFAHEYAREHGYLVEFI